MPLDSNLFVLLVRPRAPGTINLVIDSPTQQVLYTATKDPSTSVYTLQDPLTLTSYGSLSQPPPSLPNATTPNPKLRTIVLDHPHHETILRNVGRFEWEWEFEWQETQYVWNRDVVGLFGSERGFTLSVSRKPDPNYPVVTYHPRKKGGSIEIFDFNFNRVEPSIEDKKGLEITFLLALCFFIDPVFAAPSPTPVAAPSSTSAPAPVSRPTGSARPIPPPPAEVQRPSVPQPPRRSTSLAANEILVGSDTDEALESYCKRCLTLLQDQSLMYLLLIPAKPSQSPAVVRLAELVKRKRYKQSGEEIKSFVDDSDDYEADKSTETRHQGKRHESYLPPRNLKIYLSRIELSDMLPTHHRTINRPSKPPVRPPINFDVPPTPPPPPVAQNVTTGSNVNKVPAPDPNPRNKTWFGL
ncbi:uncharacterized protein JCM15063_004688 [Sporobolomyces koalae]|uniref:uncharacterized protein n=1 Tax=Sporobolomyces koalae TaxID=500713 RepID=UPI00317AB1CC